MEIKKSTKPGSEPAGAFKVLDAASVPRGTGAILCMREELSAADRQNFIVPVWMIRVALSAEAMLNDAAQF
ncbi:MAG: hypothetical protein LBS24_08235 [Clostridiales Family XIII bacterium]|nr:hypothetical protein [Clostridiales Family XIII bacterium]